MGSEGEGGGEKEGGGVEEVGRGGGARRLSFWTLDDTMNNEDEEGGLSTPNKKELNVGWQALLALLSLTK